MNPSAGRILIITSNFWPEPTGIAVYATDLAENLVSKCYDVTVLTGLPHYPWWKVPAEFSNFGEGLKTHNGISEIGRAHV